MTNGAAWQILISTRAERDLKRLSPIDQARVRAALDTFAAAPHRGDVKKLKGRADESRLRVGNLRILFRPDDIAKVFVILRVLQRGRAYRR